MATLTGATGATTGAALVSEDFEDGFKSVWISVWLVEVFQLNPPEPE